MAFAWVFPGQGAQSVGMGRALWEASPAARTLYAQADDLLGRPLSRLCFEGPEAVLVATVNAQPALFVTSLACLAALQEAWGGPLPAPRCLAGHSLGELTALVAAGALAFAEGLRLVQERGRLMQQAGEQQPGTMAAVLGLTREAVEAACQAVQDHGPVVVANDNAPGVAAILEAARVLRAERTPAGLEFVAFDAEELGLYGSQAYVRSERIRGVVGMVNLDMVGVGERFLVGNTGPDDRLVEITLEAARRVGVRLERGRLGSSDHVPFEQAAKPAAFLHRPEDPRYHSPQDTPEWVRPEFLEQAVRVVVAVARSPDVASLSGRKSVGRRTAEEYNGRGGEAAR